jgi:hypothetical protein
MRDCDERTAKWVIGGVASGEPMTVEKAAEVLNELYALDPEAADRLFTVRVPCNAAAASHPSIVVRDDPGGYTVGLIGVLNGVLRREDPCGSGVATVRDAETGVLVGFRSVKVEFGPPTGVSGLDGRTP